MAADTQGDAQSAQHQQQQKPKKKKKKELPVSLSCGASVLTALYLVMVLMNLSRLMYPLSGIDVKSYPDRDLVRPLWEEASRMKMRVYLSSRSRFQIDYVKAEYLSDEDKTKEENAVDDVVLLWEHNLNQASLSKSFLITTLDCASDEDCRKDESYAHAARWIDSAEKQAEGNSIISELKAGEGIESTSVLLLLYDGIAAQLSSLLRLVGVLSSSTTHNDGGSTSDESKGVDGGDGTATTRSTVLVPHRSTIWYKLQSNSTVYIHVVVQKEHAAYGSSKKPGTVEEAQVELTRAAKTHMLLTGNVDMIKFDVPDHLPPMGRILYKDITYVLGRLIGMGPPHGPWRMEHTRPDDFKKHERAKEMKRHSAGYPYWKPEVSIKYVNDNDAYPGEYIDLSGMPVVRVAQTSPHVSGYAMLPSLHVDEIGLTSEKYIPMNETVTSLPLRVSFDRNDMAAGPDQKTTSKTATAGGISSARWRLLTHLSKAIESQKDLGFEDSDVDDLRRLLAETNVVLLLITLLASCLHLLFEFLTFKNEVTFWNNNKDLTGLSVRSLFLDMIGQVIILLFLIEKDSSLLMSIPAAMGCLVALWKCQRAAGLQFFRLDALRLEEPMEWWNTIPAMFGYELRATRLELNNSSDQDGQYPGNNKNAGSKASQLTALTIETDRIATRTLGAILVPLVVGYTLYSFVYEEHTGWYSWLITSASSAVYALGFVLMTPQLFLNYKLKSVAHLPWRVLVYKFLNTFIDDLFAFIIRMPTMARLSCFRDDIVFIIYLYQRWLYPVDTSRPVEGGDSNSTTDSSGFAESEKTVSGINTNTSSLSSSAPPTADASSTKASSFSLMSTSAVIKKKAD